MPTVLVTGASGFIGRNTIAPLQARGYEVHSVSSRPAFGAQSSRHHVCDLLDPNDVDELMAEVRPSHLLHLAWYTAPGAYWTSEENLRWVEASLVLARAFREYGGRRLVGAGSCAEYSWATGYLSETRTPLIPSTLYGTSKHALHRILEVWGNSAGIDVAWGRIFFVYGPHEAPERLVASVTRAALARRSVKCTSGAQIRDFQHVSDTAGALVALLDSAVTGPVNIASGRPVAVREVIAVIADKLDAYDLIEFGALPMPASEPARLEASVQRLRDEVGWRDRYDLASGLDDTIGWWRQ